MMIILDKQAPPPSPSLSHPAFSVPSLLGCEVTNHNTTARKIMNTPTLNATRNSTLSQNTGCSKAYARDRVIIVTRSVYTVWNTHRVRERVNLFLQNHPAGALQIMENDTSRERRPRHGNCGTSGTSGTSEMCLLFTTATNPAHGNSCTTAAQ